MSKDKYYELEVNPDLNGTHRVPFNLDDAGNIEVQPQKNRLQKVLAAAKAVVLSTAFLTCAVLILIVAAGIKFGLPALEAHKDESARAEAVAKTNTAPAAPVTAIVPPVQVSSGTQYVTVTRTETNQVYYTNVIAAPTNPTVVSITSSVGTSSNTMTTTYTNLGGSGMPPVYVTGSTGTVVNMNVAIGSMAPFVQNGSGSVTQIVNYGPTNWPAPAKTITVAEGEHEVHVRPGEVVQFDVPHGYGFRFDEQYLDRMQVQCFTEGRWCDYREYCERMRRMPRGSVYTRGTSQWRIMGPHGGGFDFRFRGLFRS